jgi:sugar lactone lactonase YvrE
MITASMKQILLYGSLVLIMAGATAATIAQQPKLTGAFNASSGIAVDSKGYAYVVGNNDKIIRITPEGKAELFAGGGRNAKDGKGKEAGFSNTTGITIDSADNLYVADGTRIRKISPDAIVTTIAGQARSDYKDGDKATACFLHLEDIAIDNRGTIYVTDYDPGPDGTGGKRGSDGNYVIRKITAQGDVSTLKNGAERLFYLHPGGLACDKNRNLYICCPTSHCIRKISPDGVITTLAGQCDKTIFNSVYKEGPIKTAVLTTPSGIAIAKNGDVYVSDTRLNRIIKISNDNVSTVAGTGKFNFSGNPAGAAETGEKDGSAKQAMFFAPLGIAFDRTGNLYIVDGSSRNNSYIRKLSTNGIVTTFCKHAWNPKTSQYEEAETINP